MKLLMALSPEDKRNPEGKVFDFNSSHSLRVNLDRKIQRVVLPEGSSIDVEKWHAHSLRVSKRTNLKDAGGDLLKIMVVSGHKRLDNLQKYLRTGEEVVSKA